MKHAYTIAAFAFCAAAGGIGMPSAASAQPVSAIAQGSYCVHSYSGGLDSCGYVTPQQCAKYARPMGTWCSYHFAERRAPVAYGRARG